MKAVITVVGKDTVGILAKVSTACAEFNANVIEVNQSIMQDLFAMVMLVDISKINKDFSQLVETMNELGKAQNLTIHTMHESIFNSMHRI
ncbi:MAG: ACT domain-containing protein [Oscillospiraceae bacterium]|nr:ACT domain-containing protein [Oscillospiraceae bacterium]